jgi:hypothetical protein
MSRRFKLLALTCICTVACVGATAGSAFAAAPAAATVGSSAISTTSATVTGLVATQGLETLYDFQYGTTTALGKTTTEGVIPAGTTAVAVVSATINGLTPGTTYYYRVTTASVATETASPYYYGLAENGSTLSFTTTKSATTPPLTSTVSLSSKTVTLKKSKAGVSLSCKGNETCTGTLTLNKKVKVKGKKKTETKTEKLGSAKYSVKAGKKGTATVTINKTGLKLLKAAKGHKLSVTATAAAKKGEKGFKNKSLTLKS